MAAAASEVLTTYDKDDEKVSPPCSLAVWIWSRRELLGKL